MDALRILYAFHVKGIHLHADGGQLTYRPASKASPELVDEIRAHKPELIELLRWDEEVAFGLVRDMLAYVAARYTPGVDLSNLEPYGDEVEAAFAAEDMFRLRLAARRYVQVAIESLPTEAA